MKPNNRKSIIHGSQGDWIRRQCAAKNWKDAGEKTGEVIRNMRRGAKEARLWREAEKHFLYLSEKPAVPKGIILVNCPSWFPTGKGFVTATIPVAHETLQTIIAAMAAFSSGRYQPIVVFEKYRGHYVRLTRHCGDVESGNYQQLLVCAKEFALWAENRFKMKAIVSPMRRGPISTRRMLSI